MATIGDTCKSMQWQKLVLLEFCELPLDGQVSWKSASPHIIIINNVIIIGNTVISHEMGDVAM